METARAKALGQVIANPVWQQPLLLFLIDFALCLFQALATEERQQPVVEIVGPSQFPKHRPLPV